MKRVILLIVVCSLLTVFTGCGKNEKKASLLGGTSLSTSSTASSTPSTSKTAAIALSSVNMATKAMGGGVSLAPHLSPSRVTGQPSGLSGPDSDGYYTFSGYSGTTMKLRFLTSANTVITGFGAQMLQLAKIQVKITSQYSYGTFQGDFIMLYSTSSYETMESGSITSSDPIGGTFTAVFSDLTVEKKTINGAVIGVPQSGNMTITGSSGYTGDFIYATTGSVRTCTGTIYYQGTQVATVNLTFNDTFGNFTGSYTDETGTHAIQ